jgi:hypothetical protein
MVEQIEASCGRTFRATRPAHSFHRLGDFIEPKKFHIFGAKVELLIAFTGL